MPGTPQDGGVEITELLNRAAQGDADAVRDVFPAIYAELRSLASAKLARIPPGATIQTTVLVHEAYIRIVDRRREGWESIRHFYFTAARAMRDILIEDARRKFAGKRGGGKPRVPLEEITLTLDAPAEDVLALGEALARLESADPAGHQLVMLRFFAGLSVAEAAEVLGSSVRTLERRWRFLRAWLAHAIGADAA
jgi:RNA polymerase sigma factor (TIGR02999 family)